MLARLRRSLRAAGWTQARLAERLGVGTATVKRWLHGRGLALQTLERMCAIADLAIADLIDNSRDPDPASDHLTLAQEEALSTDPTLSTIFFMIVNGWPPSEATTSFSVPPEEVEAIVHRLERLALIDRLSGGRWRARLNPRHVWQRPPLRRLFDRQLKQHFYSLDYGDPDTMFSAETIKLSPTGLARLRERIETLRQDFRAIEEQDRRSAVLPGEWYAVLSVARPMKQVAEINRAARARNRKPGG
ncbi:DNA-binding transcriptional regulator, XRE family [Sphingomonas laterariae]|uniref:DNA-binding transcriptional regulator, XRE family n=2 Tax=Edaphosphingomonas laterariae TaxID=861865 RepID=A0A239BTT8_9SPHN|nr:DNA-binding transcriptional regulator, XRE family [Sphingomonas laterariae]